MGLAPQVKAHHRYSSHGNKSQSAATNKKWRSSCDSNQPICCYFPLRCDQAIVHEQKSSNFCFFFHSHSFYPQSDRRLSGRTRALSVDYGQTKNGTPLFFSHTPAPCRYSNLLPPLTTSLWSMELKQGGWEGPSVPIFDPTGAVLNLEA